MRVFQVRLDQREIPSCEKEVEVSSSSPFIRTGGTSELRLRKISACVVLLWLNETRLPSVYFSITVKSLARRKAEVRLWNEVSPLAWSYRLSKKEKLRQVLSAKE